MSLVGKNLFQRQLESWRHSSAMDRIIAVCIALVLLGVSFGYRDFVRQRIGLIFILEWLAVALVTLLFLSERDRGIRKIWRLLTPLSGLVFFAVWGLALVFWDLIVHGRPEHPQRFAQYSLLFVYPALWMGIGHWLGQKKFGWLDGLLIVTALLSALAAIFFPPLYDAPTNLMIVRHNIAIGPILVILALTLLMDSRAQIREYFLSLLGLLLVFFPIWQLWLESMQRTTLGILVFFLIATPLCLARRWWHAAVVTTLAILFFCLGSWLTIEMGKASHSQGGEVMRSLYHSDDTQQDNPVLPPTAFQGRFRAFVWAQALEDWRTNPIFGVGFRVAVPSRVSREKLNDGSLDIIQGFTSEPVSGPHNSYLTILARMGVVGAIFFALAGLQFLWRTRGLYRASPANYSNLILFGMVWAGLLYALLNIGFEAPHNSMILWFAAGVLLARAKPIL